MLEVLTTLIDVVILSNMKAVLLVNNRIIFSERAFAELVLWRVPRPVEGSSHSYKYRLAYVVEGICVLRYDNEAGKGDHRHYEVNEQPYAFTTQEQLISDFKKDIDRWNHENSNS